MQTILENHSVLDKSTISPDPITRQAEPFNGGPEPQLLAQNIITPTDSFFVRTHGTVPSIDPETYHLRVAGMVDRTLSLSHDDLRRSFPKQIVTAALECAGNRRAELMRYKPIPGEVPWGLEAIGNAVWTGVSLRRVLDLAGVLSGATDVAFFGLDKVERHGRNVGFGGSIPLTKAVHGEVLLAYEMNGDPLTPIHGAPLRLIVPGYIGARSVKWLSEIVVQDAPSDHYFQTYAYRLFPPDANPATVSPEDGVLLQEMFVSSAICSPDEGAQLRSGVTTVRGYAIGQGGSAVSRVELSIDGGKTWLEAILLGKEQPWAWQLWELPVRLSAGYHTLIARAFDANGNSQPDDVSKTWNFKGYMNNAWHRITVTVQG